MRTFRHALDDICGIISIFALVLYIRLNNNEITHFYYEEEYRDLRQHGSGNGIHKL